MLTFSAGMETMSPAFDDALMPSTQDVEPLVRKRFRALPPKQPRLSSTTSTLKRRQSSRLSTKAEKDGVYIAPPPKRRHVNEPEDGSPAASAKSRTDSVAIVSSSSSSDSLRISSPLQRQNAFVSSSKDPISSSKANESKRKPLEEEKGLSSSGGEDAEDLINMLS